MRAYNSIIVPIAIFAFVAGIGAGVPKEQIVIAEGPHTRDHMNYATVDRIAVLEDFFDKYNSPLKDHADTFVQVADKYDLDYTLLPAISCMESTCGQFMIPDTYNPFGWGIYGNNYIAFEDFDEAIKTVGEGLNEGYFSKGYDTPEEIAPIYTPPNSGNWLYGVNFFRSQINEVEVSNQLQLASYIELH